LTRPRLLQAGPDANLAHLPVCLDLRALSVAEGVRAALSVAVIVAANEWADFPPLSEAALAALLTCLCDAGGPIRRRVPALLAFAAIGASLTAGLGLLRSAGLPVVVPCACLVIFCTSFARIWGQSALQVGNLLTVVTVLAMDRTISLDHAGVLAASFVGGSLWALLLTMVIWRIHPFRPARRAVAEVFRRMGVLAGDLSGLITAAPNLPTQVSEAWADHARGHRRHVRDGIEAARTLVLDTVRARGPSSARSNQTLIQMEAADQVFGALIALSDVLEFAGPDSRAAARLLHTLRLLLAAIADDTGADHPADDAGRRAMVERLLNIMTGIGRSDAALAGVTDALADRLRVAALLTTPAGLALGTGQGGGAGWRERFMRPLRANLTGSSASFRHAIRAAVAAGPALVITLMSGNAYAHWLTITLVLTMQPFFALTWQRAVERIIGTVLGGMVAAGLALMIDSPLATAAALFPLAVMAFAVRYVSFGLFMACMTPLVVLLSEIGRPGESELLIAGMRALYTVLGGVLAVLGCAVLWPSWEPGRLSRELRGALEAHAAYADTELAVLLGEQLATALDAMRRASGVASNNLEASLARALQEPRRSSARTGLEAAMVVDAALRRLAGRLSSFQHDPASVPGAAELAAWRDWLRLAFQALADGEPLPPGQPQHEPGSAMARIARQVELMDGALRREEGRAPAPARSAAQSLPLPP